MYSKYSLLAVLLTLSACNNGESPILEYLGYQQVLEQNRQLWHEANISDYQFIAKQSCFCPIGAATIVVLNNMVAQAELIPPNSGSAFEYGLALTVEQRFDIIQRAIKKKYEVISVTYNKQYAYPEVIRLDGNRDAQDDEITYVMEDFHTI